MSAYSIITHVWMHGLYNSGIMWELLSVSIVKLEFINILTDSGEINENGGEEFKGKPRFQVREEIIDRLKEMGLYRGKLPNKKGFNKI